MLWNSRGQGFTPALAMIFPKLVRRFCGGSRGWNRHRRSRVSEFVHAGWPLTNASDIPVIEGL
jgi:hypothetical protein